MTYEMVQNAPDAASKWTYTLHSWTTLKQAMNVSDPFQDALPCFQRKELHCDMERDCRSPVTHIGSKGYAYCATHAVTRRQSGYERTRKMTVGEIRQLRSGEPLEDY